MPSRGSFPLVIGEHARSRFKLYVVDLASLNMQSCCRSALQWRWKIRLDRAERDKNNHPAEGCLVCCSDSVLFCNSIDFEHLYSGLARGSSSCLRHDALIIDQSWSAWGAWGGEGKPLRFVRIDCIIIIRANLSGLRCNRWSCSGLGIPCFMTRNRKHFFPRHRQRKVARLAKCILLRKFACLSTFTTVPKPVPLGGDREAVSGRH